MIPIEFPGSREVGKPTDMTDEQCASIPAAQAVEGGMPVWITCWQPSYEDIEAIKNGLPIYVKTVSRSLPPMLLLTLNESGESNA